MTYVVVYVGRRFYVIFDFLGRMFCMNYGVSLIAFWWM